MKFDERLTKSTTDLISNSDREANSVINITTQPKASLCSEHPDSIMMCGACGYIHPTLAEAIDL